MEVGELDLNGGGQESRGGLDDHRHHFGVKEGGVTVEKEDITVSVIHVRHYSRGLT